MNRWDKFWLNMCNTLANHSVCLSRKIGAVIVTDKTMISSGYNGPPRNVPHCGERVLIDKKYRDELKRRNIKAHPVDVCPRQVLGYKSGEGLEWCVAGHAERNAIVNAAREGHYVKGAVMYMDCGIPCTPCLVEIINAGISEIVVVNTGHYDLMSRYLLENSHLKYRTYNLEE